MTRKLLFFDMDGTLWDYRNYIPESAIKAIKLAQGNGHKAFINTGRSRSFIRDEKLLGIGFDGIVSGCGTMIEYDDRVVWSKIMPAEEVDRILEITKKHGFKVIMEGTKCLYANVEEFPDDDQNYYMRKISREMGEDLHRLSDVKNGQIQKFSCSTRGCDRAPFKEELKDSYDFIEHNDAVMEVVPKGHNKGTGIQRVCELLGAQIKDTFAFGDSINDKEMLIEAGTGIVMDSGTDEAKKYADHVTTGLLEDGIMNAMRYYSLI
ncbi:MAG: Cof-type HAD-IIB family hydrolase [Lachnospiraceae bacterium]|nr:Cof-type HAD-IIB family hydrolase [Lachnospiraceae bacterium]